VNIFFAVSRITYAPSFDQSAPAGITLGLMTNRRNLNIHSRTTGEKIKICAPPRTKYQDASNAPFSQPREQHRQQRRTVSNPIHKNAFVYRVRALADASQPVQSRDAQRRGEIAIRSAAG
jgi:hypothetical protein